MESQQKSFLPRALRLNLTILGINAIMDALQFVLKVLNFGSYLAFFAQIYFMTRASKEHRDLDLNGSISWARSFLASFVTGAIGAIVTSYYRYIAMAVFMKDQIKSDLHDYDYNNPNSEFAKKVIEVTEYLMTFDGFLWVTKWWLVVLAVVAAIIATVHSRKK